MRREGTLPKLWLWHTKSLMGRPRARASRFGGGAAGVHGCQGGGSQICCAYCCEFLFAGLQVQAFRLVRCPANKSTNPWNSVSLAHQAQQQVVKMEWLRLGGTVRLFFRIRICNASRNNLPFVRICRSNEAKGCFEATPLANWILFGMLMESFDHTGTPYNEAQSTSTHRGVQVKILLIVLFDSSFQSHICIGFNKSRSTLLIVCKHLLVRKLLLCVPGPGVQECTEGGPVRSHVFRRRQSLARPR